MANAVSNLIVWVSGGAVFIFLGVLSPDARPLLMVFALCLLALGWLAGWLFLRAQNGMRQEQESSFVKFLGRRLKSSVIAVLSALNSARKIAFPTGWKELNLSSASLDRVLSFSGLLRGWYFCIFIFLPVLLAMIFVVQLRASAPQEQSILAAFFGYNALATFSCLTVATLMAFIALSLLKSSGLLTFPLSTKESLVAVATCAGQGTAAGLVAAALMPVMIRIFPMSSLPGGNVDLSKLLNVQLFIDIPAAATVIGFGCGLIVATVRLCGEAKNIILRRIICPIFVIASLMVLKYVGMDPAGIVKYIASNSSSEWADCSANMSDGRGPEDDAEALPALVDCGAPIFIDGSSFIGISALLIGACVLVVVVRDFRQGYAKIREDSSAGIPL